MSEWQDRVDIFERSYNEVLSALKHQDDKLNRTLTAIAFLTAAGVALYTQIGRQVSLTFDGKLLNVPTFFFLVFLVAVVLALSFTLAAIGPSTPFRRRWRSDQEVESLLFYASIYRDKQWDDYIKWAPDKLRERVARNFHAEARKIARRIQYKVARSREASSFVQMMIISLGLLGIFSAEDLTPKTRWSVSAWFLLVLLLLPLWDLIHMLLFRFPEGSPSSLSYGLLLLASVWAGTLLFAAPAWHSHWLAMTYTLGVILVSRLALIHRWVGYVLLPVANFIGVAFILSAA